VFDGYFKARRKPNKERKKRKSAQSENAGLSKRLVNEKRIPLGERIREIGQSTDKTRMSPLKRKAILIRSVFYRNKLDFRWSFTKKQFFISFVPQTSNKSSPEFFRSI
jgi:hypothetical protein